MLDWATAAFMKRKSRIAEVMAAVPMAAQATCRMKSRRFSTEGGCFSIRLFLDGVIGGSNQQVDNRANTVAHLRISGRGIGEIGIVGDVINDNGAGAGGQLAGAQK